MKTFKLLLFAALIPLLNIGCSQTTIELPLIYKDGYGPFYSSQSRISAYSGGSWKGIELKTKGIPDDWKDAEVGGIQMNIHQTVYQNYLAGNVSEEWYTFLQEAWTWTPDTLTLSKEPIKSQIVFAYNKDILGNFSVIIDANNNLDFSDDKIFSPMTSLPVDSIIKKEQIMITYERFLNNKVMEVSTPIVISYVKEVDMLMCNYPGYAVVKFKGEEFAICSDNFGNSDYENIGIIMLNDSLKQGKKANSRDFLSEYIKIDGETYKNKGVDLEKNVLVLEKMKLSNDEIYSTQVGFKAPLFTAENFITKNAISLEEYRGKYLYIDFWTLGCGPCIAEFPHLKELYDKMDKSQFEFLGIISGSRNEEDNIKKMMNKHFISWPHIVSNKEINLTELYDVNRFPTTILLDKEGRVIAKDLRSRELESKIKELTK